MGWVIFLQTLRRGWRTMVYWGIGVGLIGILQVIAVPDVNGMKATGEALAKMPPFIVQLVGGGDLAFLASPAGYLNNQYFSILLVIFGIYALISGLNVTSNDEAKGIMDIMLSMPIRRWNVVLEKLLAYSLLMLGAIIISDGILYAGILMTPAVTVSLDVVIAASMNLYPAVLTMLAFTALVATLVRRRGQATAVAVVFLIGSWFIDVLGRTITSSIVNSARVISFYAYYNTADVMQHGLSIMNLVVLAAAACLFAAGAIWIFERRNIAV